MKLLHFLPLVLLAACQANEARQRQTHKTLMIKASGEVETLPNEARFSVQLSCLDKSVAEAKECLVQKSNELNKKLLQAGLKQEDILTTSVDLEKSYSWERNSRVFEGYRSSTTLYVTVKDLEKLDLLYTDLLENPNLEIGGLSYSHSQLDSLKNDAYVKALRNAKKLAAKLTTELPQKDLEILKVGNVAITSSMPEPEEEYDGRMLMAEAASNQSSPRSVAISKGTVKVMAELYVEFRMK